jgi:hypothetical protein
MDNNSCKNLTDLIDLRQAAELLPRRASGQTISTACVKRWMVVGSHGVHLHYVKLGCRYLTSREWIVEFIKSSTEVDHKSKFAKSWQTSSETKQFNDSQQAVTLKRAAELGLIERKESF